MITYPYRCGACGSEFAIRASIKDDRSGVRCECGAVPEQVITGGAHFVVRGMGEYKLNPRKRQNTFRNRSAKVEERNYEKVVEAQRQLYKERKKAGAYKSDDAWTPVGIAPAPLVDAVNDTEGDKNAVLQDPIPFLKSNGLYMEEGR